MQLLRFLGQALLVAAGAFPAFVAHSAFVGLGLHRHGPAWAVSASASILVFGPALFAAIVAPRGRASLFGLSLGAWSVALLLSFPLYFPGERREAVATGVAVSDVHPAWSEALLALADRLPADQALAEPLPAPAAPSPDPVPPPPAPPLDDRQIALPYEGAGRRLSITVHFSHGGREIEREMMVDTGATYTTLGLADLRALGLTPGPDAPTITLHTANGERKAQVVLLDRLWLGDLPIDGVAIATCEACASAGSAGLLGLNVAGNYNLTIDADRREVVFTRRESTDRRLDLSPFVDVDAHLERYPGGRVEVDVRLDNKAPRRISTATAEITCNDEKWSIDFAGVEAGTVATEHRRLPEHAGCEAYGVNLRAGGW